LTPAVRDARVQIGTRSLVALATLRFVSLWVPRTDVASKRDGSGTNGGALLEAFEQLVKVYLEHQRYVVTTNVKFAARRKTKKTAYDEYQTHGYEIDVVAARHGSLVLGSVKSFLGSGGVDRQGFRGIADESKTCYFGHYAIFNDPDLRAQILAGASERFGYPLSQIVLKLFVGRFRPSDKDDVIRHLTAIKVGAGPVGVVSINAIMDGLIEASRSKTYYNEPVIMTIKALRESNLLK